MCSLRLQLKMSSIPPAEPPAKLATPELSVDFEVQENYVSWALKNQKVLPPISWDNFLTEVNWLNATIVGVPTLVALYGIATVKLRWETAAFSVFYYFVTALGEPFSVFFYHTAA